MSKPGIAKQDLADLHFMRGIFRLRLAWNWEALSDFEEGLMLSPKDARLHRGRALSAMFTGDNQSAFDHATTAVELNPESATNFSVLGQIHSRGLNDHEAAVASFNSALALEPGLAAARLDRMLSFINLGKYALAEDDAKWLLSQPAKTSESWGTFGYKGESLPLLTAAKIYYGRLLGSLGREEEAEKIYDELIKSHPSPQTYLARALYHAQHGVRKKAKFAQAIEDARAAVRLDPGFAEGWRFLAKFQMSVDDHASALYSIDAAIGFSNRPEPLWDRATILRALGRTEDAANGAQSALMAAFFFNPSVAREMMLPMLKRGYLTGTPPTGFNRALADAIRACMVDKECF
ncbi:MAG: hypothetical protein JSS20_05285 [Proteobacteria bacterium]|nr:hypothetical protein [Pseudomonadota bacterium]